MAVDLKYLANDLTDEEFARLILSSGDYFPGFYRFTLGDRNHENGQLSVKGLVSTYLDQMSTGRTYSRDQWTAYTKQRHQALNTIRNQPRSDFAVYEILDQGYLRWMTQAEEYDIALIEIDKEISEINKDVTYFFMGAMIRFTEDSMLIGYDSLRLTHCLSIPIDFAQAKSYVESIYSTSLKDLFLPTDLVASLKFTGEQGNLHLTNETLLRAVLAHENSVVIASNRDVSKDLPIRWAKDIILTEVTDV